MWLKGTLDDHVAESDREGKEMLDRLTKQIAERKGVTEQLKVSNQMAWVGAMNNIRARVAGLVYTELLCC